MSGLLENFLWWLDVFGKGLDLKKGPFSGLTGDLVPIAAGGLGKEGEQMTNLPPTRCSHEGTSAKLSV